MGQIIVGMDGSTGAATALRWAVREAGLRSGNVTAVLVWSYLDQPHTDPDQHPFDPAYGEAQAREALDSAVEQAVGPDAARDIHRQTVCDLPAAGLVAASQDAELLVVGARGLGGFRALLLGSVSEQCLTHAHCPVAVIRMPDGALPGPAGTPSGEAPERIVVGVDGSEQGRDALRWALDEARARQATVTAVHAWRPPVIGVGPSSFPVDPAALEGAAKDLMDRALDDEDTSGLPAPVERIVQAGPATHAIIHALKGADLAVVGSRGRGGFKGLLLGSVSHQIARHADCPVVVVPGKSRR